MTQLVHYSLNTQASLFMAMLDTRFSHSLPPLALLLRGLRMLFSSDKNYFSSFGLKSGEVGLTVLSCAVPADIAQASASEQSLPVQPQFCQTQA